MTTEDFIDVHKGDSLTEKLQLLVRQHGIIRMDAVNYNNAAHNHNVDQMAYWISEKRHIEDRCEWLYGELSEALAEREPHKEQKPVEAIVGTCQVWGGDYANYYKCGACKHPIGLNDKYCRTCGRKVKWE